MWKQSRQRMYNLVDMHAWAGQKGYDEMGEPNFCAGATMCRSGDCQKLKRLGCEVGLVGQKLAPCGVQTDGPAVDGARCKAASCLLRRASCVVLPTRAPKATLQTDRADGINCGQWGNITEVQQQRTSTSALPMAGNARGGVKVQHPGKI